MRVNIYAEEMTDRVAIITKEIDGHRFTGLRFYLELPVTIGGSEGRHYSTEGPIVFPPISGKPAQVAGPFMHRPGDDDSSAVTFWGKRDLRDVLRQMLALLDAHYAERSNPMTCDNYHSEKTSPDCPYCIMRMLTRALELRDPNAPELTPATVLLEKAKKEREWARRTAR